VSTAFRGIPAFVHGDAVNPRELVRKLQLLREAVEKGIGTATAAATRSGGGGTGVGGDGGTVDLTPPPTPTGLIATGGITYVLIEWDPAFYTQGNGHGQTNIYGATYFWDGITLPQPPLPTFGDAIVVGVAPGPSNVYALASEPATQWHFWIKWQTNDGVESTSPAGGINGVVAITGQDVERLLKVLEGQITQSQLLKDLSRLIYDNVDFVSIHTWQFNGTLDGWIAGGATLSTAPTYVQQVTTVVNPTFARTLAVDERFIGGDHRIVRAKVRRTAGTGAWEGNCYYSTAGHGASNSFVKKAPVPIDPTEWSIVEWDMGALTFGGTDWITNEILAIRLDFTSVAGDTWQIDWVSIGTPGSTPGSAAIEVESAIRQNEAGQWSSSYTVRTQVSDDGRTVVGGFGLTGYPGAAGPTIDFGVIANRFWVAAPAGSGLTDSQLFIVQTTPTTINGVSVPAGTYMNSAYIQNGTITNAKIGTAAIDNAKIANLSAAKIIAGSIQTGEYIQSTGYVPNTTGWRISGNGIVDFRGGLIGGVTIGATFMQSTNYLVNVRGWRLDNALGEIRAYDGFFGGALVAATGTFSGSLAAATGTFAGNLSAAGGTFDGDLVAAGGTFSGDLSAAGGTFAGNLSAAGGTFDGNLSAAGGTFSGTFTASAINAVNTINIAGNAVTVPVGASGGTAATGFIDTDGSPLYVNYAATGSVALTSGSSATLNVELRVNSVVRDSWTLPLSNGPGGSTITERFNVSRPVLINSTSTSLSTIVVNVFLSSGAGSVSLFGSETIFYAQATKR
jgi:hypothetical protein